MINKELLSKAVCDKCIHPISMDEQTATKQVGGAKSKTRSSVKKISKTNRWRGWTIPNRINQKNEGLIRWLDGSWRKKSFNKHDSKIGNGTIIVKKKVWRIINKKIK